MIIEAWDVEKLLGCFPGDCYKVYLLNGDGQSEWMEYDKSEQVPESLLSKTMESFKMYVGADSALYIIYS